MSYYIPEIIVGVVLIVIAIALISVAKEMIRGKKGKSTCMKCKSAASKNTQYRYLFLLPLSFGDTYDDAENYLRTHMRPIMSKEQIPSGQRACWVDVFDCPCCGNRQIEITDFLQVRGEEYAKAYHKFAYDSFRPLLDSWTEIRSQSFSM